MKVEYSVSDCNISLKGQLGQVSVKILFTTLIDRPNNNSSQQKYSIGSLAAMVNCLDVEGTNGPFSFCQLRTKSSYIYISC